MGHELCQGYEIKDFQPLFQKGFDIVKYYFKMFFGASLIVLMTLCYIIDQNHKMDNSLGY